jgi:subtilisin family serine protease
MKRLRSTGLFLVAILLVTLFTAAFSPTISATPTQSYVEGELIVQYKDGADDAKVGKSRQSVGGNKKETLVGKTKGKGAVELLGVSGSTDDALKTLQRDESVEYVEYNWIYTTGATSTDTFYTNGSLWGMYGAGTSPANQFGSNAGAAWAAGYTGSAAVYVGVIDEGIQTNHPDLAGQIWTNPYDPTDGVDNDRNGYVDDTNGWDFAGNNRTVYDGGTRGRSDSHGTHVAGTIGAKSNGSGVVGVNWNVTMISGKFLGSSGGTTANAVRAVDYFTDLKTRHGLNIVATNNSWGGGGYSQALFDAISRANNAGILFIAAAGNSGTNNDTTASYPSNYNLPNVIAVAAIANNGTLASFSQYGATTVDLGAPGVGINSTIPYNRYASYNGTSMATPHVTGAAALYASVKPGATAAQIKNALLSSAVPTASLAGKTVTGGRLDAFAALSR